MVNTLRLRQNGRHFADGIFKCIFLNENARISLTISQKFVPKVRINNIPALVQIMAWHRPGDKPLSEPVMVSLLTHICVTRPQWVKLVTNGSSPFIYMMDYAHAKHKNSCCLNFALSHEVEVHSPKSHSLQVPMEWCSNLDTTLYNKCVYDKIGRQG